MVPTGLHGIPSYRYGLPWGSGISGRRAAGRRWRRGDLRASRGRKMGKGKKGFDREKTLHARTYVALNQNVNGRSACVSWVMLLVTCMRLLRHVVRIVFSLRICLYRLCSYLRSGLIAASCKLFDVDASRLAQ